MILAMIDMITIRKGSMRFLGMDSTPNLVVLGWSTRYDIFDKCGAMIGVHYTKARILLWARLLFLRLTKFIVQEVYKYAHNSWNIYMIIKDVF